MSELTREQVVATVKEFKESHLCEPECDHDLQALIETDAALRHRVAEVELRRSETVAMYEQLRQQLVTVAAERDDWRAKYRLVLNDPEYAQCCDEREKVTKQLSALTLTWTIVKPTEAGWYWWRDLDRLQFARPYVLIEKNGRLDVMPIVGLEAVDPFTSGEWAGPIPMPTEAQP